MLIGTQADNVRDMLDRERVGMKSIPRQAYHADVRIGCAAVYVAEKMKQSYDMQLDVSMYTQDTYAYNLQTRRVAMG